jgi:hypothetical protein
MAGLSNLHISIIPLNDMACSKSDSGALFEGLGIRQIGSDTRIVGGHDGNMTVEYKCCNGYYTPLSSMQVGKESVGKRGYYAPGRWHWATISTKCRGILMTKTPMRRGTFLPHDTL